MKNNTFIVAIYNFFKSLFHNFKEPQVIATKPISPPIEEPKPIHKPKYLWCIDNGHGVDTPGKRSPKLEDGRQLLEFEFNRKVVDAMLPQLHDFGIRYFLVCPGEMDLPLRQRVMLTNQKESELRKIFVSIHANAGPTGTGLWSVAKGLETWFKYDCDVSQYLAEIFQRFLVIKTGLKDRGIKSKNKKQFFVLRNMPFDIPAILTENGFFNNRSEVELLLDDSFVKNVAEAHVAAILEIEQHTAF